MFHPAYAAVTLGLLHGSQPDLFIVCHEPGANPRARAIRSFRCRSIEEVIAQTVALGKLTNPAIRCAGISLNTSALSDDGGGG